MKPPQVGPFAKGNDSKINVAVQRPTVNIREAENVGEQLAAVNRSSQPQMRLSRHATFGPSTVTHPGFE